MNDQARLLPFLARRLPGLGLATALLISACNGNISGMGPGGGGGNGPGPGNGQGGNGGTGPTTYDPGPCTGDPVMVQKRMVRLTFNQIVTTIRAVFGDATANKISTDPAYALDLLDVKHRGFPPLGSPREGSVITDGPWLTGDQLAQAAAKYVLDNFATVTGCTQTGAALDACAQTWLRGKAAAAWRRPLTAAETTSFNQLYTDLKDATKVGVTSQQATQFSVYGILEAPQFLYRTEFGTSATAAGAVTPYELASEISYFLTDGPPDAMLLAAAANNMLTTSAQVTAQVDRLLATPAAQANLHGAMFGYFAIPAIENAVIDTNIFTTWNEGLRNSMERETDLFLQDTLWKGKVTDLLTSKTSFINATLAPFYGASPPTTVDADGFGKVTLPANRAGILTQGGFLVARARPMAGSVVGRGLLVNASFLCATNPAFPTELATMIDQIKVQLANQTERAKSDYRRNTAPCSGCHPNFDPYGLALENYDGIGRYRTMDEMNRAIDASVTLPALAGGATVNGAIELGAALASGGAFANCVAKNLLNFALAETPRDPVPTNACAVRGISDQFKSTDGTFSSLVRGVAVSTTLASRTGGIP
jgi:hypothetical protein